MTHLTGTLIAAIALVIIASVVAVELIAKARGGASGARIATLLSTLTLTLLLAGCFVGATFVTPDIGTTLSMCLVAIGACMVIYVVSYLACFSMLYPQQLERERGASPLIVRAPNPPPPGSTLDIHA